MKYIIENIKDLENNYYFGFLYNITKDKIFSDYMDKALEKNQHKRIANFQIIANLNKQC